MKFMPAATNASRTPKDAGSSAVHPNTLPPKHNGETSRPDPPSTRRRISTVHSTARRGGPWAVPIPLPQRLRQPGETLGQTCRRAGEAEPGREVQGLAGRLPRPGKVAGSRADLGDFLEHVHAIVVGRPPGCRLRLQPPAPGRLFPGEAVGAAQPPQHPPAVARIGRLVHRPVEAAYRPSVLPAPLE